jgi:pimeloyl-ACP methyl ester carboxylesterase
MSATSDITQTRTGAPTARRGQIGLIVVGSFVTGLTAALLLVLVGEDTPSWAWIVKDVAPDTRVCVYDRAGQGWSESAAGPQDGVQLAADLHTLLERAAVPGPYVLAGHSVGGTYALTFAARYPQQVAGMVLLDSSTPRQFTALPGYPAAYSTGRRLTGLLPPLARVGLWRLADTSAFGGLPPQARSQELALAATTRELSSQRAEWSELPTAFTQAQALTGLNGKPLIVVTAGLGQQAGWFAAQDQLARLSTNSVRRGGRRRPHRPALQRGDVSELQPGHPGRRFRDPRRHTSRAGRFPWLTAPATPSSPTVSRAWLWRASGAFVPCLPGRSALGSVVTLCQQSQKPQGAGSSRNLRRGLPCRPSQPEQDRPWRQRRGKR